MSFPVNINRDPLEEFKDAIALIIRNSIYFFNPVNCIVSVYEINDSGFSFTATRYDNVTFMKHFNFIYVNKATRQIDELEFNKFINQINVLQEQSTTLKPLVTFEEYIQIIKASYGINQNKGLY